MPVKAVAHDLEGTVPELLSRLEQAQARDDVAEAQVRRYGTWFLVCLLTGLIGWLPLLFVTMELETVTPLLLCPIALVAAVVFKLLQVRARRFDLDDRRLEAGVHVLRMLAADTALDGRVKLQLDFRGYRAGGRVVSKEGGFFSTVKRWKYSHEWLQLTGALIDGTRYQLTVTDTVGRKTRSKRKYVKVKERFRSQIALRVRMRPRHGGIEPVVALLESMVPPPPLERVAVSGSGLSLEVRLATPATAASKGRYGTTPADPARLVSGDMILAALLWTWDGIGRTLERTA
jgi:hypothetical protein